MNTMGLEILNYDSSVESIIHNRDLYSIVNDPDIGVQFSLYGVIYTITNMDDDDWTIITEVKHNAISIIK
jgi:hypothetical protein